MWEQFVDDWKETRKTAMTREEAIKCLTVEIGLRSSGYYDHLAHGGKQDVAEEESLDSLQMAISALREQDATDTNVGHKTNADHIRAMTDEELAELLYEIDGREGYTFFDGWVDWLKQPYGGDA